MRRQRGNALGKTQPIAPPDTYKCQYHLGDKVWIRSEEPDHTKTVPCPNCKGRPFVVQDSVRYQCHKCHGSGYGGYATVTKVRAGRVNSIEIKRIIPAGFFSSSEELPVGVFYQLSGIGSRLEKDVFPTRKMAQENREYKYSEPDCGLFCEQEKDNG